MAQYLYLIYADEAQYGSMTPQAWQELLGRHDAFAKAVVEKGGTVLGGGALQPSPTATSVRGDGALLTDGPFLTVKEQLGGFYQVEVADLDVALELAKLVPAPTGGVEMRPLMDLGR